MRVWPLLFVLCGAWRLHRRVDEIQPNDGRTCADVRTPIAGARGHLVCETIDATATTGRDGWLDFSAKGAPPQQCRLELSASGYETITYSMSLGMDDSGNDFTLDRTGAAGGRWGTIAGRGSCVSACPAAPPRAGDACPLDELHCGYQHAAARCFDGRWLVGAALPILRVTAYETPSTPDRCAPPAPTAGVEVALVCPASSKLPATTTLGTTDAAGVIEAFPPGAGIGACDVTATSPGAETATTTFAEVCGPDRAFCHAPTFPIDLAPSLRAQVAGAMAGATCDSACPAVEPAAGDACALPSLSCDYAGEIAVCGDGGWRRFGLAASLGARELHVRGDVHFPSAGGDGIEHDSADITLTFPRGAAATAFERHQNVFESEEGPLVDHCTRGWSFATGTVRVVLRDPTGQVLDAQIASYAIEAGIERSGACASAPTARDAVVGALTTIALRHGRDQLVTLQIAPPARLGGGATPALVGVGTPEVHVDFARRDPRGGWRVFGGGIVPVAPATRP